MMQRKPKTMCIDTRCNCSHYYHEGHEGYASQTIDQYLSAMASHIETVVRWFDEPLNTISSK